MTIRSMFAKAELTALSIATEVKALVQSAPSLAQLEETKAKAATFGGALTAARLKGETLVSAMSSKLAGEALESRALALLESGATTESHESRMEHQREEFRAVREQIKVLEAAVAIAERNVAKARGKVSAEVNARSESIERAIVARFDEALRMLTEAFKLERAFVSAFESEGISRHRYQPSSFGPSTYAEEWSMASIWRREQVKAGQLDAESSNTEAVA